MSRHFENLYIRPEEVFCSSRIILEVVKYCGKEVSKKRFDLGCHARIVVRLVRDIH